MHAAVRVPAGNYLAADYGVLVQQAHRRPLALPAQGMVEIYHHIGRIAGRIGETQDSAAAGGGHLGLHPVIQQVHAVVSGRCAFALVAEAGLIGGAGHEEEIPQVRNAGAAEVRKAESHYGGTVVLVAGGNVVVEIVGIRAYLYASEGNLRPGIDVPEAVGADEGIHIIHQALLGQGVHCAEQCQRAKDSSHNEYGLVSAAMPRRLLGLEAITNSRVPPSSS